MAFGILALVKRLRSFETTQTHAHTHSATNTAPHGENWTTKIDCWKYFHFNLMWMKIEWLTMKCIHDVTLMCLYSYRRRHKTLALNRPRPPSPSLVPLLQKRFHEWTHVIDWNPICVYLSLNGLKERATTMTAIRRLPYRPKYPLLNFTTTKSDWKQKHVVAHSAYRMW